MKFVSQAFKFNDIRAPKPPSESNQAGFGGLRCCVATTRASAMGSVLPI
jgi:hypothetical protein